MEEPRHEIDNTLKYIWQVGHEIDNTLKYEKYGR